MRFLSSRPNRRQLLWAGGLLAASNLAPTCWAADPPVVMPRTTVAPADVLTRYTLGEAIAIAHKNHPSLAALRASLNAAHLKQKGLQEVKHGVGGLLVTGDCWNAGLLDSRAPGFSCGSN